MKQACFQNALRKKRKKKALHRGTFEVVKFFPFNVWHQRGRGSKGICARVSQCVARTMDVAVCVHALQGHLLIPALHTGTSVCAEPVPGSTCVSVCGFAHSCGFAHACSQWLESIRGLWVATCLSVGWFPPK